MSILEAGLGKGPSGKHLVDWPSPKGSNSV